MSSYKPKYFDVDVSGLRNSLSNIESALSSDLCSSVSSNLQSYDLAFGSKAIKQIAYAARYLVVFNDINGCCFKIKKDIENFRKALECIAAAQKWKGHVETYESLGDEATAILETVKGYEDKADEYLKQIKKLSKVVKGSELGSV